MTHVLRHPAASRSSTDGAPPPAIGGIRVAFALIAGAALVAVVAGFVAFAATIANARPPVSPEAEGIVVLTGGSARIDGALRLLTEHRASRLLISGVNPAVGPSAIADTIDPEMNSIMTCCVDLGHAARDTIGNATETRDWANEHGYRSLIVVTSDYHMPRSLAELADAMPGVELIPYPVSNPELHLDIWWRDADAFALLAREYGKYLLTASRLALSPLAPPPAAGLAGNASRPPA